MAEPAHPPCVCNDCLPGGAREHRVRPWPAKPGDCEHPIDPDSALAKTRLVIPTTGGGRIEQCRLCGAVLRPDPA